MTYIHIFILQTVVWKVKQSFVCDLRVTPSCPLCLCYMQSTLILFGLACLKQIFLFVWFWDGVWLFTRLEASPSPSVVGLWECLRTGIWVSLDHLIHCTCHYLRGMFVYVGLAAFDGCVIRIHNLQDSSKAELDCGHKTFSELKLINVHKIRRS